MRVAALSLSASLAPLWDTLECVPGCAAFENGFCIDCAPSVDDLTRRG